MGDQILSWPGMYAQVIIYNANIRTRMQDILEYGIDLVF